MRLAGQVAVVTGGASGLGLAMVDWLITAGAQVVLMDLPGAVTSALRARLPGDVHIIAADVTDSTEIGEAFVVASGCGPVRAVVHAAGISRPVSVLGDNPQAAVDEFRRIVEVNLVGTFNVLQHAAKTMATSPLRDGDRGVVVTTASIAAFDGMNPAYSASKGGVAALTLPAARALASSGIRVVSVAPGLFETPMLAAGPVASEALSTQVPHPSRLGRPEEFAALAGHIIENPMLNGEVIRLDGAYRVTP